jgi:hypothetical protein
MTAPSFSLFVKHPTGEETEHLLGDETRVGRLGECEVRVASAFLSRVHFVVRREGEGHVVVSQHPAQASTAGQRRRPGTYVNGSLLEGTRELAEGDVISPMAEPGPRDPTFRFAPTVSPTPADQLPQPPAGLSGGALVACALVLLAGLGLLLALLTTR